MPLAYSFGSPMQEARLGSAAALGGPHSPLARATPGVASLKASADAPIMSVVFTTYLLLSPRRGIQSQPMGKAKGGASALHSVPNAGQPADIAVPPIGRTTWRG